MHLALRDRGAEALAVLEKIKDHPQYTNTRAKVLAMACRFDEAAETCLAGDATFWQLKLTQGIVHLYRGDWKAAIVLFTNPIAGFPEDLAALYLAITYRTMRRFEEAHTLFKKLTPAQPGMLAYHLGILHRAMGRDEEALASFQEQAAGYSFTANQLELLLTLRKLKQHEAYQQALEALPEHASLRWEHKCYGARHDAFTQIVDHYLRVEAGPLPKPGRQNAPKRLERYWLIQSQNLTPMFFVQHDRRFFRYQQVCPFAPGATGEVP